MSPIIEAAAYEAARVVQNELMAQAPSDKIAKGLTVVPIIEGQGDDTSISYEILLDENVIYGVFLDSGTLEEYDPNDEAEWDPNPGKGEGGIKPRYWISIPEEAQVRIDMIIEAALETAKEKEIEEMLEQEFGL